MWGCLADDDAANPAMLGDEESDETDRARPTYQQRVIRCESERAQPADHGSNRLCQGGDREAEVLGHNQDVAVRDSGGRYEQLLGESAVEGQANGLIVLAQVPETAPARPAGAASNIRGDCDRCPGSEAIMAAAVLSHHADRLMPWHSDRAGREEAVLPAGNLQIGSADANGGNVDNDVSLARHRIGAVNKRQLPIVLVFVRQHGRLHFHFSRAASLRPFTNRTAGASQRARRCAAERVHG